MNRAIKKVLFLSVSLLFIVPFLLAYSDQAFGGESFSYSYDTRGRLMDASCQSSILYRYGYDEAGNLISISQMPLADSDGDFLPDNVENTAKCPFIDDADSDDDGILDGVEDANRNGLIDPGETDPCNADTDGDGIQDGTELGVAEPLPDPDGDGPLQGTDPSVVVLDADPSSTTNPLMHDTDEDGLSDGAEDADHNGKVDAGESSPVAVSTRSITGIVYSTDGSPSINPVTVKAYSGISCGGLRLEAVTRSEAQSGVYTLENLAMDSYYVLAEPSGGEMLPEWYSPAGDALDCSLARPVSLSLQPNASGINITLNPSSSLSGTVLKADGTLLETAGIYVNVYSGNGCTGALVKTALLHPEDGSFGVQGLGAGEYFLQAVTGDSGYQAEWWSSSGDAYLCSDAEAVTVIPGGQNEAISMRLDRGSGISGTVFKSDGKTAITGETIAIEAYMTNGCPSEPSASALVNEATGVYLLAGLKPGNYHLKAKSLTGAYIAEWWSTTGNAFNCLQAGTVTSSASENTSNVNFQLDTGGSISGTIFEADGTTPVTEPVIIEFYLYQNASTGACGTPAPVTYTTPSSNGSYRQQLPPGKYYMRVNASGTEYAYSWWSGTGGEISCEDAQYNTVQTQFETSGRNFKLWPASSISGHIYQSDGVTPAPGPLQIIAYSDDPCNAREVARGSYDPATGQYVVNNLSNHAFTLLVAGEGTSLADEWWSSTGNAFFCFQAGPLQLINNEDLTERDILLDEAGSISGTVFQKDGATPVGAAMPIGIYPENSCGSYRKIQTVSADPETGQYAFPRLGPGNYTLLADPDSGSAYIDEWWSENGDAFSCENAGVVSLAPGGALSDKHFNLDAKSTISGTLYKPDGATMNLSFRVYLYSGAPCQPVVVSSAYSNRYSGAFSFSGLKPGRYHILVNTSFNTYASEWWSPGDDAFACAEAGEIVVSSGENVANLEVHLDAGAKISGALYKEDGVTPLTASTQIVLYRGDPCENPETVTSISTSSGTYEIDALPPGEYYMKTATSYYYERWWSSQAGNAQSCAEAQKITIASVEDVVEATDFRIKEKGSISGKLFELDGTTPITDTMSVYLYRSGNSAYLASTWVSEDGGYAFRGIEPGDYLLRAHYDYGNYISAWWSDTGGAFDSAGAQAIVLTEEGQQVIDRDFNLHKKGRISGKILKNDGSPIDSETVYVYYFSGASPCSAEYEGGASASPEDGSYTLTGINPGSYFLRVEGESAFIPEWWSSKGDVFDCDGAELIPVAMDQTVSDRDFTLCDCSNFSGHAPNDAFENASVLTDNNGPLRTNNFCATAEADEPDHTGYGDGARSSLWWRWTAPNDGNVVFKTENPSFDTVLSVYSGDSLESLTLVAQDENWGELSSSVSFNAQQGQDYQIAVDTVDGHHGFFTLISPKKETLAGDLNGDALIDLSDAILVLQVLTRTTESANTNADVNADGRIGTAEALFILQTTAEMRQ